jgi:hypothetical protein
METASASPSLGEREVTFYLTVLGTLIVTFALGLFALYSAVQMIHCRSPCAARGSPPRSSGQTLGQNPKKKKKIQRAKCMRFAWC